MECVASLNDSVTEDHFSHFQGRQRVTNVEKRVLSVLITALLTILTLAVVFSSRAFAQQEKEPSLDPYSSWVGSLPPEYRVVQGNAFRMTVDKCPTFIAIFNSCFGNNPAAPYIIPQPPIEDSYVDPYYATGLNTRGPNGQTTNIIYRLTDQDALVTIVSYPPKAAYLGYISYVFTSLKHNYRDITPPTPPTSSPSPYRYDIFGSIGNDVNDVIVQNQLGFSPWNKAIVVYITTSNATLATALIERAKKLGIDPRSIFVEPIGSNVITGNGPKADDMVTLMRYAIPRSSTSSDAWQALLQRNVLVYKVSNPSISVKRYGTVAYTPHIVNTDEKTLAPSLSTALQQLGTLLRNYLAAKQFSGAEYRSLMATTDVNAQGVPDAGLVGSVCIQFGTDCLGDDQDTSTYALLPLRTLGLQEAVFIVGVNHNRPDLDNTRYVSIAVYDADEQKGVASASQTNSRAVGFESGTLNGSARGVLDALKISIPSNYADLIANLPNLYVAPMARNIDNPTIAPASQYTINLEGTSLLPRDAPLLITERSYIVPGTTAGGNVDDMLYPLVVAAIRDFVPSQSTSKASP